MEVDVVNAQMTSHDKFLGILHVLDDLVDIAGGYSLFDYFVKLEFVLLLDLRNQCQLCPKIEIARTQRLRENERVCFQ